MSVSQLVLIDQYVEIYKSIVILKLSCIRCICDEILKRTNSPLFWGRQQNLYSTNTLGKEPVQEERNLSITQISNTANLHSTNFTEQLIETLFTTCTMLLPVSSFLHHSLCQL